MTARLIGCLLVCGMALAAAFRPVSSVGEALVLAALLLPYLGAFLYGGTHISAVAMGFAAGLLWLDLVVIVPPVPDSIGLAVVFTAAGAAGTAAITRRPVLALNTAAAAAVTITALAWLLLTHGPARFVPLHPGPHPLAQNRIEVPDHYYWLLLIGSVLSIGLVAHAAVTAKRGRVRRPDPVRANA